MSWRRFLRRGWWNRERARELASYLEIEIAENVARGMNASRRPNQKRAASWVTEPRSKRRSIG